MSVYVTISPQLSSAVCRVLPDIPRSWLLFVLEYLQSFNAWWRFLRIASNFTQSFWLKNKAQLSKHLWRTCKAETDISQYFLWLLSPIGGEATYVVEMSE